MTEQLNNMRDRVLAILEKHVADGVRKVIIEIKHDSSDSLNRDWALMACWWSRTDVFRSAYADSAEGLVAAVRNQVAPVYDRIALGC